MPNMTHCEKNKNKKIPGILAKSAAYADPLSLEMGCLGKRSSLSTSLSAIHALGHAG